MGKKNLTASNQLTLQLLKAFTRARIGLSDQSGVISTVDQLQLNESLAKAKDSIDFKINFPEVLKQSENYFPSYFVQSLANDRPQYLKRPDFGKKLSEPSKTLLRSSALIKGRIDLIFVDGLSPQGLQKYALSLLVKLNEYFQPLHIGQVFFVENGRVAIGDAISEFTSSRASLVIIGERPGLSSFDSLGAYITYMPKLSSVDADRNCISNICESGLPIDIAAKKIFQLVSIALQMQVSGVKLKEDDILKLK